MVRVCPTQFATRRLIVYVLVGCGLFMMKKTPFKLTVLLELSCVFLFSQAEDGIRDHCVTGVQTCALPISERGDSTVSGSSAAWPRAGTAAVDAVVGGEADNAFCAVRPPGHHAEPERAMGFCLFNNAAIGALRAREVHGLARVAVVDFDVHHGNGTQAAFETDGSLFYASTHQYPLYPGTGARSETGVGNVVNVPLRPMSGSTEFRRAYDEFILPALEDFAPDFILISAGFDAHRRDPLAQLMLVEEDYAWVTA